MSYIILLFIIVIVLLILFTITLGIDNGYIAVGTCKCGGKYRYFFHDSKWGKNVYICDKCKKRIM